MLRKIVIKGREIGVGNPCFIVAEAGVNHNGDPGRAQKMVNAAKNAGADAVKFQTFHADEVVIRTAPRAMYQQVATGSKGSQHDMILDLELSEKDFYMLAQHAEKKKIIFLSTPFDTKSVDILDEIGVPAFKIPSGEITNIPLISHIAKKKKPVILSTGMATMDEVTAAVQILRSGGTEQIALLHCVTSYPAETGDLNLLVMETLARRFKVPVGFSDHSLGIIAPVAAAALGACIIEKHFTLKKSLAGPDHQASLDPVELHTMVAGIRQAELARGTGIRTLTPNEREIKTVARRSIVSVTSIRAGSIICNTMLAVKRPGTGIEPSHLKDLLGRKAKTTIPEDTVIGWDMIE